MLPCQADCPLPPSLSSVPPFLSAPSLPASTAPLRPCLNLFEAQMWADSGYFSSRRDSFMCHKRSIHIAEKRTGLLWIPTPWRGSRGSAIPGPANTVMFYTAPRIRAVWTFIYERGFTATSYPDLALSSLLSHGVSVTDPWHQQQKRATENSKERARHEFLSWMHSRNHS